MAKRVFNARKFIKTRMEAEEDWRKKFRRGTVTISLEDLGSQDTNPFARVYPEHKQVLSKPHLGQQHRMQDLRVAKQYANRGLSTLVVLPTNFTKTSEVTDYFGAPIEVVADQCVRIADPDRLPPLLPMILNPADYLENPALLELYRPLFKRLHDAGRGDMLVFANRMEDCLTYQNPELRKGEGKGKEGWAAFKEDRIAFWADKGADRTGPITIGDLPVKKPSQHLGERIAWLEILGLTEYANDIKRIALDENDVEFACHLAFILQTLFISPILYSHKTTSAIHDPFDSQRLFAVGTHYLRRVTRWRVERALRYVPVLQLLAMLLGYAAYSHFVDKGPPDMPYIIPLTVEATKKVQEITLENPDDLQSYDDINLANLSQNIALGRRSEKNTVDAGRKIEQIRERIVDIHREKFAAIKEATRASVRVLPIVGSLWTPEDPRLRWFTRLLERETEGKGLVMYADKLLEKAWTKGLFDNAPPVARYRPDFRRYDLRELVSK